jgi:hypothetical protein
MTDSNGTAARQSTSGHVIHRVEGGRCSPGVSANPAGKPKAMREVAELAKPSKVQCRGNTRHMFGEFPQTSLAALGGVRARVEAPKIKAIRAWTGAETEKIYAVR